MRFFSLLFVFIVIPGNLIAQDSLRVLSWNIQMLPSVAKAGGKAKRARAIVNQLNSRDYDVIVFQEIFHKRSRKIVRKGLSDSLPYHTKVLNKKFIAFKTNGGIMIFSKFPITEIHQIRYSQRKGFDALSRKGALMAEIDFRGRPVQVIGTHLQAFSTQEILYSQYQELSTKLLQPNTKAGVPQIIVGDFNTMKSLPPKLPAEVSQEMINRLPRYPFMLQTLNAEDGDLEGDQQFTMDRPHNDLCTTRKEYRLLIDYILVRSNGAQISTRRQVQIIRQKWSKNHQDLSDHFALEGVVTFQK